MLRWVCAHSGFAWLVSSLEVMDAEVKEVKPAAGFLMSTSLMPRGQ